MTKELSKKERIEKQRKFDGELRLKKVGKPKKCTVTKGDHVFDTPYRVFPGANYEEITLNCKCGKRSWDSPRIRPLRTLPRYSICGKHGYQEGIKSCWACEMNFPPFEKLTPEKSE